jgi:homoserine kinase type II
MIGEVSQFHIVKLIGQTNESIPSTVACELAVALSKYAGEKEALNYFREFVDGYKEHGHLTPVEISCVPDLIILRILSNVVYFVGRAYAGEDTIDSLTSRAEMYFNRIKWIKEQRQTIIDIVAEKIIA